MPLPNALRILIGCAASKAPRTMAHAAFGLPPTALDRRRDPFAAAFDASSPAYLALTEQLDRNAADYSMKYGPDMAFHNHAAALLTSVFRLGAEADELRDVIDGAPELDGLRTRESVTTDDDDKLVVDAANWEAHLGGFGLYGLGAHTKIPAYQTFFAREVAENGALATLRTYLPRLAQGAVGDFFHALIELGYYFESGRHEALLPVGLAWIAASYAEVPPASLEEDQEDRRPGEAFDSPLAALEALSRDSHPFPTFDLHDGSSGYIAAMEDLAADPAHRNAVLKYDLARLGADATRESWEARLREVCCAAVESFAAGGHDDFFLLHLVTGSRAVWAITNGMANMAEEEGEEVVDGAVLDDLLGVFWRAMLFTHVARNRPWRSAQQSVAGSDVLADAPLGSVRPWDDIVLYGRRSRNSHAAKVIMNCADFWDRWRDDRFWRTADGAVGVREAGGKFVGTGVGSKIGRFVL